MAVGASSGWAKTLTATEAAQAMKRGELRATDYVEGIADRIAQCEPTSRSFVEVYADEAMECARASDARRDRGQTRPLESVVFAVKDSIDVSGRSSAAGSRSTQGEPVPAADADVVSRLRQSGAILIGKLVQEELGIGPTTDGSIVPAPRNPWNVDRSAGGSSSGCGVAVAAGLVPIAIGTDTAGSIRLPAANCGVVGFKPSHGRVNRRGVMPLAPSLDDVGIIARDVADIRLVLRSTEHRSPLGRLPPRATGRLRVGVVDPQRWANQLVDVEISAAFDRVAVVLCSLGVRTERVALAPLSAFQRCGATILHAEAYHEFRRRLETRGGSMHPATYRRLASGAHISPDELVDAHRAQAELARDFDRTMARFDVLVTISTLAPPGPAIDADASDHRSATLSPRMPFNVVGAPALALPVGLTSDGLPISVQLVGARGDDWRLLRVAEGWEHEIGMVGIAPRDATRQQGDEGMVQ